MTLEEQLILHEGLRLKPYRDSVGKLTLGAGRNLDDVGITEEEALYLLRNDITRVRCELEKTFPWFDALSRIRKSVLMDMCFNLGLTKLLGFKMTLRLISERRYSEAADHMLLSKWAGQVGVRAKRLAHMIRTDTEPDW